ncbi:MAG: cytochrome c1 [Gammaproteobacteria bacterium]|nr:cytochrome c1 [Gammaproteobacteria bacterium]
MKKSLIIVAGLLLPVLGWAAGGGAIFPNDEIDIDWDDKASMQRGARTFVNYCMGCHALAYSRYNRVGEDLGISEEQLKDNLIFTTNKLGEQTKVGELMKINMTTEYGEDAFGIAPPDLSLIARSRGVDWLYNYLRGFYVDESRPFGMNNGVFANVGMPHALVELQGLQAAKKVTKDDGHGNESEVIVGFEIVEPGSQSKSEFDQTVHDLVAFLDYVSEPYRQTRHNVGTGVIIFLFIFLILAYLLKKEYWKDIH